MKYTTENSILARADEALNKTLRDFANEVALAMGEKSPVQNKGGFGILTERILFGLKPSNCPGPDFKEAGIELKTIPLLPHHKKAFKAKERLVFSKIDYHGLIHETWEKSHFLQKNGALLLLFYLFAADKRPLDYTFLFQELLKLLSDLPQADLGQIKSDWEYIKNKVERGEAHLLSGADTFYLEACTKAANSAEQTTQPRSSIKAKPRAFALKQRYVNVLVSKLRGIRDPDVRNLSDGIGRPTGIEEVVAEKTSPFKGKTNIEIEAMIGWHPRAKPKHYARLLSNRMLSGNGKSRFSELEKSNTTMRVATLEPSGVLRESISFEAFDYCELARQAWEDSTFYSQLEAKRFLFMVFQKSKDSGAITFVKAFFWNFPACDMPEARRVWNKARRAVLSGDYSALPKISESGVAHVRPHGRDGDDKMPTPQGGMEVKKCFWLNAKYLQRIIGADGGPHE